MKKQQLAAILAAGLGLVAIAWYFKKKPAAAAPGAGGPSANAGGATPARAAVSATGGSTGSIPNIIAAAAALSRAESQVNVPLSGSNNGGIVQSQVFVPQIADNADTLIIDGSNPSGFQGTQLVSSESTGTVALPGLGDFAPDVASSVSALDVGGTDFGTVYA